MSWYNAARFCNWLHNGQPNTGSQTAETTEDGAYTLNGATRDITVQKNAGAKYWIPSQNEWYKAAYYQPAAAGGDVDGYWKYATKSNAIPNSHNGSASDPNSANFYRSLLPANDGVNDGYAVSGATYPSVALTPVGAFALASSYYGTFDQNGNVREWFGSFEGRFGYLDGTLMYSGGGEYGAWPNTSCGHRFS